jgi:hypothetical protein
MQYIYNNDRWEITYTDSTGSTHTFFHPSVLTRNPAGDQTVTEEIIRTAFPTDAETEEYVNYMRANDIRFDDDSQP